MNLERNKFDRDINKVLGTKLVPIDAGLRLDSKAFIRQLGRRIESSTESQNPEIQLITRKLEADAYTFAARNTPAILKEQTEMHPTEDISNS